MRKALGNLAVSIRLSNTQVWMSVILARAMIGVVASAKVPDIPPCVVESLIDTAKFPNAFRMAPSNSQWDDAVRNYCLNILKVKKVAVIGDTTGYGVTAAWASVAAFKK